MGAGETLRPERRELWTTQDVVKERIKFYTEAVKLLAVLLIASMGGVISLLIEGVDSAVAVIFSAAGLLLGAASTIAIYTITAKILRMVNYGK